MVLATEHVSQDAPATCHVADPKPHLVSTPANVAATRAPPNLSTVSQTFPQPAMSQQHDDLAADDSTALPVVLSDDDDDAEGDGDDPTIVQTRKRSRARGDFPWRHTRLRQDNDRKVGKAIWSPLLQMALDWHKLERLEYPPA